MSVDTQIEQGAAGALQESPAGAQHGLVAHGHGAGVPEQSRAERRSSGDPGDFAVPSGREEDWRFTPLDRLHGLHDAPAVDGRLAVEAELSGAEITLEHVPVTDPRVGAAGLPEDRAAALAWAGAQDVAVVTLTSATGEASSPALAQVALRVEGSAAFGHVVVRAQRHARGVVVLDHRGAGRLSANVEIDVEDAAELTVVSIQDWDDDAVHLAAHHARLGRDARLRHVVVTFGGDLVRITPAARFTAPGGEVEMLGLYFADAGQHQEHRLFVDHAVPHCRSNVVYKGALQGEGAHTVWVGDVLIRAAAEGTDTYELNRNLVLTDGARADSVPNLEIETGEIVGAGHASATGRFDDEQLFYLQARGIPEEEARRLVVRGFFAELVQQIGVPEVEERLLAAIDAELAVAMGTSGPVVDDAASAEVTA
ncbi:MAG: Fe-S cluster assembly protein SufD [Kineosporiaceae bacterium]